MRWPLALFLAAASLAFLASSILYAVAPEVGLGAIAPLLDFGPDAGAGNAALMAMARPQGAALRLLLAVVWLAVLVNAVHALRAAWRDAPAAGRDDRKPPVVPSPLAAPWPVIVALLAGALWPWSGQFPGRGTELALVAVMAGAAIWASVLRRQRRQPGRTLTGTVEVFAGWATVALYSSFAAMLTIDLGVSPALAAVVAVLLLMATAVEVQMRIGNTASYSFAVIWALIGIAAGTMGSNLTIAMAAVIAIAALAAVLVRVLS